MKRTIKTAKNSQQTSSRTRLLGAVKHNYVVLGILAGIVGIVGAYFSVSSNAATQVASISTPPETTVFTNIALQDSTVMQSFTYDQSHKFWIFVQVSQAGRNGLTGTENAKQGNLTLTKISPTGQKLGFMYLKGFGHGVSISVEPIGAKTYLWSEAGPIVDHFGFAAGTKIARFEWKDGVTLTATSPEVVSYGVNAGAPAQTPYVDAASNRIAISYYSTTLNTYRWAIYPLDKFKARDYTPLVRVSQPANQTYPQVVHQGWAMNGMTSMMSYSGTAYDATNVAPGNARIYVTDTTTGLQTGETLVTALPTLTHREAEGLSIINGNVCVGFASGITGARRANIVCQRAI